MKTLISEYPGYSLLHGAKMLAFQKWTSSMEWTRQSLPSLEWNLSPQNSAILRWLGMNLFNPARALRTPQLYIHGRGMMGKTTLLMTLSRSFKTFFPSHGEKYWDGFDDSYELIAFDEFSGKVIPLSMMKMLLDGQTMTLPQRYHAFSKTKNIPIICCSNFDPVDVYHNLNSINLDAFLSRLHIIEVHHFIKIFQ